MASLIEHLQGYHHRITPHHPFNNNTIPQNEPTAPKDGRAVNIQPIKVTADVAEQSTPVVVKLTPGLSTRIEIQETTETSVDNSLSNTSAPSLNVVISP